MKLYAYKQGSASAKALADALGIKRIKHEGKPLTIRDDFVINWGCSNPTRGMLFTGELLNNFDAVGRAANKLKTFEALDVRGVNIPEYTTVPDVVGLWIKQGHTVVCREKLNGHSGEGITIVEPNPDGETIFPNAPLYTKYIKKENEYRIHVMNGKAHFLQRKARKLDVPDAEVNWKVRNLAGGFIFANQDVEVDDVAIVEACNAVAALGLDFGAVDIIHTRNGEWYVLEVNTACGLEGATLESYVNKFREYVE